MHAQQCIGRAANQYSCLTYTAWVETLYTGIGLFRVVSIVLEMHQGRADQIKRSFERKRNKFSKRYSETMMLKVREKFS